MPSRLGRLNAPKRKFSSVVKAMKVPRPSGTWPTPARAICSVLRVSISGLTAPSGTALAEIAGDSAETAVADGWNVYVGGIRQNSTPIALTSTTYTLAADPATSGTAIGDGQRPTVQIKPIPFVMHG